MSKYKIATVFATINLIAALFVFAAGSAAFHGALFLTYFTIPAALLYAAFGSWRLSALAIYFSVCAWLSITLSKSVHVRIDYLLASFLAVGLVLGGGLYVQYRSVRLAT